MRSWVPVPEGSDFTLANLPFGYRVDPEEGPAQVVAIGEHWVVLPALAQLGLVPDGPYTERLEALGLEFARELRRIVADLLREENPALRDHPERDRAVAPICPEQLRVPFRIGAFVDFYSSEHHAANVGRMFRPQSDPLLPNWKHLPVGYNGRASTVVPSGVPVRRPRGQRKPVEGPPVLEPTRELDFELEMGFFLGEGNRWNEPIPVREAERFIFGFVLVNDWSARDVQRWEYQPLGPFLAKSFATSISPWVVMLDALEPFRTQGPVQDPEPLPYLRVSGPSTFSIQLRVLLQTARMREPQIISETNFAEMYWSPAQQLAHQTVNGTRVERGDLYASGTISGPNPGSFGSLLELAWKGERPIRLEETGEERIFLEDGDTVIFQGWAGEGDRRVGFGELRARIEPA